MTIGMKVEILSREESNKMQDNAQEKLNALFEYERVIENRLDACFSDEVERSFQDLKRFNGKAINQATISLKSDDKEVVDIQPLIDGLHKKTETTLRLMKRKREKFLLFC